MARRNQERALTVPKEGVVDATITAVALSIEGGKARAFPFWHLTLNCSGQGEEWEAMGAVSLSPPYTQLIHLLNAVGDVGIDKEAFSPRIDAPKLVGAKLRVRVRSMLRPDERGKRVWHSEAVRYYPPTGPLDDDGAWRPWDDK